MVHTNETGSPATQYCAICLMIVKGGALYNFGFLLLQKLHFMIIKFKNLSELVAILILAFFIKKKPSKVRLLANAGQKSYE